MPAVARIIKKSFNGAEIMTTKTEKNQKTKGPISRLLTSIHGGVQKVLQVNMLD